MKLRKLVLTVSAAAVLAVGSMVAFAAWTASGSGSGNAKALTAQASVLATTTPTACLYPGKTACAVEFTVTNPNPYPVRFTSAAQTASSTITSDIPACDVSSVTITPATGLTIDVPANTTVGILKSVDMINMVADADNDCQGATFAVPLTLSGASNA